VRPSFAEVIGTLSSEGLLPPERAAEVAPRLRTLEVRPPWYVRAISGMGGWTAAAFVGAFAWFIGLQNEPALIVGAILLAVGIAVRRTLNGPFSNQLALALALSGELLALQGMHGLGFSAEHVALATLGVELLLVVLYPDPLMRFVSTILACVAMSSWLYAATDNADLTVQLLIAFASGMALFVVRPRSGSSWLVPVAYGLTATSLGAMAWLLSPAFGPLSLDPRAIWGVAAIAALFGAFLLHEAQAGLRQYLVGAAVLLAMLLLWSTPGVLAATAVLAMGFARRDSKLIAIAAAFLLLFGAQFYYLLDWSLLAKSGTLVASGLLFLALRFYVERRPNEA
jgi:hypothetical protein